MDTNNNMLVEIIKKKLKIYSENYDSNIPPEYYKKSKFHNFKKHSDEKTNSRKRHKRTFTNSKKTKKMKLNDDNTHPPKNKHQNPLNTNIVLKNNFHEKNKFHEINFNKSQDEPIKINLVSQKFKIANDFNEKNSNQFLNDKDECLREVILSDEIKENDSIHFYDENEKRNIFNLSLIKNDEVDDSLNIKKNKQKV